MNERPIYNEPHLPLAPTLPGQFQTAHSENSKSDITGICWSSRWFCRQSCKLVFVVRTCMVLLQRDSRSYLHVYHISCERDIKSKRKHTLLSFTSHCHIILASKPSFARLSSQSLRADLIWSNQNRTTKILFESCCLWHMEMVLCGSILLFLVACFLFLVSCVLVVFASKTLTWNLGPCFVKAENPDADLSLAKSQDIFQNPSWNLFPECHFFQLLNDFLTIHHSQKKNKQIAGAITPEETKPLFFPLLVDQFG